MVIKNMPRRVADVCWAALALLSHENQARSGFTAREIRDRIHQEWGEAGLRPGVQPHIYQHAVANAQPSAGRYRLLYRLPDRTFRLYRPGDDYHPQRSGKTQPSRSELPSDYHYLLDWYEQEYAQNPSGKEQDPILALWGLGSEIWEGVDPDAYVRDLRSGWEDPGIEDAADRPEARRSGS
jgi:hypothetical protein